MSTTEEPIIKKVSQNGQLGLGKNYSNTYVKYWKKGNQIILEPMFWDEDLGTWLTKEEKDELMGENIWSANQDNNGAGISLENL